MADWCPHDDDPMTCPPCQRAADVGFGAATPTPRRIVTFPARFPGNCSCCGRLILPGDAIVRDDENDGYLREECAREALR